MSAINDFHRKAMDIAALALVERSRGNTEEASVLFERALQDELAAIQELEKTGSRAEPTYSVLHRSAGTLALDCNQLRLAEQLAAKGLAHTPHSEIAEELRDLLEQINFRRHLEPRGIELGEEEVQLSLAGHSVSNGTALLSDLVTRVDNFQTLIYRIAQRKAEPQYDGRIPVGIRKGFRAFASAPRAGSFAMSLKLGRPLPQASFPGVLDTGEILDEFMDLMELANESNEASVTKIRQRITAPEFQRNFLGLAKKLAPDGDRIRQVGFTVVRGGIPRYLSVTTPASRFPPSDVIESTSSQLSIVEISGTLLYATATTDRNRIKIVDQDKSPHDVIVPVGLMDDIVRPMWNSFVTIRGSLKGNQKIVKLREIWESDPNSGQGSGRRVVTDGSQAPLFSTEYAQ